MASPLKCTTTSGGYNIAYSVSGRAAPFVEMPCSLMGDIAKIEDIPAFRSVYDPLAERFKLGIDPEHSMLDTFGLEAVV